MESRRIPENIIKVVAVASDMITPYGNGTDACWENILAGRTAISKLRRFDASAFQSEYAATIEGLEYLGKNSLVEQMLVSLFEKYKEAIPDDASLIVASTKGEIDLLEKKILKGQNNIQGNSQSVFLEKVSSIAGTKDKGMIISAACSSAAAAVAGACAMIKCGRTECVLVIACDSVTEFVFSGFSSLMALDKFSAMPFDKNRNGLSVGEAAAFVLLMSEARARKENREITGEVLGWGLSDDANHMTGPARGSEGLILALKKTLLSAGADDKDIGFISAHGTGTVYNDSMEMRAFKAVFTDKKPVYSIKGGIGHTMAASGLVEMIIAMRALRDGKVPPTVNLKEADMDAEGWVSTSERLIPDNSIGVMTNAGFGGINAALVLG
ncbi:MAG: beta-ketoacyl-[acyl-carrier-protein] synthase family protein [Nitrospirae bacterium]|nr:beta-ketoacyl-[acyl-carrier-protein] synthase family protein [Nitrospirota bacterium]